MLSMSRSGPIGKLRELAALSGCLTPQTIPARFRGNELVLALLEDSNEPRGGGSPALSWSTMRGISMAVATARLQMLPNCERVAALLADKTPWPEADGMKRWMLWLATCVAKASSDRWLGLVRRVSAEEATLLVQIARSLHISTAEPVPAIDELDAIRSALQDADDVPGERRWT
jgi:hypothetical protein